MKQKEIEKNNLDFIVNISKFNMVLTKTLDSKLWWLWFNDFIVLYHLNKANDQKLKRIELAEKVWLTASGITRLLLPMEKIWLISKEVNSSDARISYVSIAPGWKTKLDEALERLNYFTEEIIDKDQSKKLNDLTKILQKIWWKIMWK
jgi:DNA-binding MarR family transcriptional regulator